MRECLAGEIPNEPKATCHDCAMCAPPGHISAPDDPVFYDPEAKCCTYMPMLWNFLVGALLEDESPEASAGRRTVEARIAAGIGVTPLGLDRPPAYVTLYRHVSEAFGQTRSMRCPHFIEEGGLCGVWRARESTCATWFCKHERGAVGKQFWEALHRLLLVTEQQVATWCLLKLDIGTDALAANFPFPPGPESPVTAQDFDGRVTPERRRLLWGSWDGRERAYYLAAGRLARELAWKEILALAGTELAVAAVVARAAYDRLTSPRLPERLRAGSFHLTPAPDGGGLVTSYSPVDPLRVSAMVLRILPYFDGRHTTRSARQAIARDLGQEPSPDLLQKLVDYDVLVDAGQPPS
jgi:hypothetical protein